MNGHFQGDFSAVLGKKVQQLSETTFTHKLHSPTTELSKLLKRVIKILAIFPDP